jgi:hypothetical protein
MTQLDTKNDIIKYILCLRFLYSQVDIKLIIDIVLYVLKCMKIVFYA